MADNVTLALKFDPSKHDVLGWQMSEKLDGVRAIWNGEDFLSRELNRFDAPYRIVAGMQKIKLESGQFFDGELYMGRGNFNDCSGIARRHGDQWFGMEYRIFDFYTADGSNFSQRFKRLNDLLAFHTSNFIKIVEHQSVRSLDQMWHMHDTIVQMGGEGVMLRNPLSEYEFKRTKNLLKVKKWNEQEANVVGMIEGKGKYVGMLGALVCQFDDGTVFQCGSGLDDTQRVLPNQFAGERITVKFFEKSKDGVPRFPIFKGIRIDG